MDTNNGYEATNLHLWQGRTDGIDPLSLRWHQKVEAIQFNSEENLKQHIVFLGFACDEGVKRNGGRVGAAAGPEAIRKAMASFPVHFKEDLKLGDAGNIICTDGNLEEAQQTFSNSLALLLKRGAFPILLGGGHEITYAHFNGLRKGSEQKIGCINFDAHFDLRAPILDKGNSGTGFYQIYQDAQANPQAFHYMAIGIQQNANTKALFDTAEKFGVNYVLADEICSSNLNQVLEHINHFMQQVDVLFLTIDLDVFAAAYAPGVSATAGIGIIPDHNFKSLFQFILNSPKLKSVDIAELNPQFDVDNRTAKLAADLIFRIVQSR